jgi:purine catabolism regulator
MLSVKDLVGALELELVAGERAAGAPIRWVHVSELEDPAPWLSGGELLLSTGMQLLDESSQRAYIGRLVEHHLAGLGFGVGFAHQTLPPALVDEARELEFPLFAVPYEMPFIAITERAFSSLVNEQLDVLQRAVAIQRRMERLVLDQRSLGEVVRGLANSIGATVMVLDSAGRTLACHAFRRELDGGLLGAIRTEIALRVADGTPRAFMPQSSELAGRAIALPVPSGAHGAATSWLVAVPESDSVADFERFLAHHAVMVVALAQMRERVVAETERRLAGDVLGLVLSGRIDGEETAMRLAPFEISGEVAVAVFGVENPEGLEDELARILAELGAHALVATVATARRPLLCAVIAGAESPLELVASARELLAGEGRAVRAAVSHNASLAALRRSFHEARCALEVGALANGSSPAVACADDLGAYRLLLSLQEDDGLRQYCDDVLGPIERSPTGHGDELLRSLEAFLEHNGSWEAAARALFCHRHTLRYRMSRIEELTGRRLDRVENRIEFWLALRGCELLGSPGPSR